jgi:DnaJ-class molecular chaperone with C-terminal Zn finger domain
VAGKQVSQLRQCFFQTVFRLLGYIANCDGGINGKEIRRTNTFMEKLQLTPECKVEARELFAVGAKPGFDFHQTLAEFKKTARRNPEIVEILLVYLLSMATTDGPLRSEEMRVVQQVAGELGFSSLVFDHLLKMVAAQDAFARADKQKNKQEQQGHTNKAEPGFDESFAAAFAVLGVTRTASDSDITKAYRKLVNQYHPDKLVDKGFPPEMIEAATERFRAIRAAYEYLRRSHYRSGAA